MVTLKYFNILKKGPENICRSKRSMHRYPCRLVFDQRLPVNTQVQYCNIVILFPENNLKKCGHNPIGFRLWVKATRKGYCSYNTPSIGQKLLSLARWIKIISTY